VLDVTFVRKIGSHSLRVLLVYIYGIAISHGRASLIVDTRERMGLGRLRRNTAW
jgi:hypothetical protein